MKEAEYLKRIKEHEREAHIRSLEGEKNRAQAISVGTANAGVTEITMRTRDGRQLWFLMQPVEVIEFINQLSANVGCHIHITPRNDFSSWREWKELTPEDKLHLNGHPPHPNPIGDNHTVGATLPPPEKQVGMQPKLVAKEKENAVAIKKTVNKRSTKRSRTATK